VTDTDTTTTTTKGLQTMAYRRIETTSKIQHKRAVPTVLEILTAIRRDVYRGAVHRPDIGMELEAGCRVIDGDRETSVDCSLWPEDSDLWDFESLASILKVCRKTPPEDWPKELDLYVRDSEELLGNVDLRPSADGWTLVSTDFRYIPDTTTTTTN
jgi:hypothetical protein